MIRSTLVVLSILMAADGAAAQATIKGCVTDTSGWVLPGVEIVAANAGIREKAVTNASGCYQISDLPPGDYSVTAVLAGFVTGKREKVSIGDASTTGRLDFVLCIGALGEILFVVPPSFDKMWETADVVAHVRITGTNSESSSPCQNTYFRQAAAILEIFKAAAPNEVGETLTLLKENWAGEPVPYPIGEELVVFLKATSKGLVRLGGPAGAIFLRGSEVVSATWKSETTGVAPAEFLARLRARQQTGPRPFPRRGW